MRAFVSMVPADARVQRIADGMAEQLIDAARRHGQPQLKAEAVHVLVVLVFILARPSVCSFLILF
jgi:hypothetical protein